MNWISEVINGYCAEPLYADTYVYRHRRWNCMFLSHDIITSDGWIKATCYVNSVFILWFDIGNAWTGLQRLSVMLLWPGRTFDKTSKWSFRLLEAEPLYKPVFIIWQLDCKIKLWDIWIKIGTYAKARAEINSRLCKFANCSACEVYICISIKYRQVASTEVRIWNCILNIKNLIHMCD